MNTLLQMIPSWESSRDILEPPMMFLLQMANRILTDDNEEVLDRNKDMNSQTDSEINVLKDMNSHTDTGMDVVRDIQLRLALPTIHSSRGDEKQSNLHQENYPIDLNKVLYVNWLYQVNQILVLGIHCTFLKKNKF